MEDRIALGYERLRQNKQKHATHLVRLFATAAFVVGVIPLPIVDAALLIPLQVIMVERIANNYEKNNARAILAGMGSGGLATVIGRLVVGSFFKLIPGVGTIVGGLISGAVAGTLTTAIGVGTITMLQDIDERSITRKI